MANRAFVSVSDKEGIVEFARELVQNDFEIVSTGGTYNLLKENGINVTEISTLTGYPEMLSGKVKSLHPEIFAGILADMTNSKEVEEVKLNHVNNFNMVVVNLYPFEQVAMQTDNIEELIKNIDIGGVSLLRAGAKNYKNITVICDKADYPKAINADEKLRSELAIKTFNLTSNYDRIICSKLGDVLNNGRI